jgi:hypothetical protein
MALTTVAKVEALGALTYNLFDYPDQATLDAFVQESIDDSDAWMQSYMGLNYNPVGDAAAVRVQTRAQAALALSYIVPTLRSKKTYGTHYPVNSEDSAAYDTLMETDWEAEAKGLLSKWITVEVGGTGSTGSGGFAAPAFRVGPGVDPDVADSEETLMDRLVTQARSFPKQRFGVVR